jgi:hypothetical protein
MTKQQDELARALKAASRLNRKSTSDVVFTALIKAFSLVCIRGWALMLALGMVAGWSGLAGLAVGFWPAVALSYLIRIAITVTPTNNK